MTQFINILKALRISEVLLMSGFFMVGALFSIEEINVEILNGVVHAFVVVVLLILAVYSFNAYCGKKVNMS